MTTPLTVADLSILGAVIAYLAPGAIVKFGSYRDYDNAKPRDPAFFADPYRARGLGAHQNGIEGFAFFAAAVIVAQMHGAAQSTVDALAVAYVLLRVVYIAAYLGNKPSARSGVWFLAMAANIALFLSPLFARG